MKDQPPLSFKDREVFRRWLEKRHTQGEAVWLLFDKTPARTTLSYTEALEEALCFGWIDGQVKSLDERFWIRKFSPRRKRSTWSVKNRQLVEKLMIEGRMAPAGLAAVERARAEGTWDRERELMAGADSGVLEGLLSAFPAEKEKYRSFPPSLRRQYSMFYLDAKTPETRRRRLEKIVEGIREDRKLLW
ncbi:MAG: hypothetical protein HPY50_09405 [Firmicutes bacterium]|nr:hypothetical protein [Bacillota bacterium]